MFLIWILMAAAVVYAAFRAHARLREVRPPVHPPRIDDEALRRILEEGTLTVPDEEPLDMEEASEAEEDFWSESWDEPEEYRS
jgi:hypothetical protein